MYIYAYQWQFYLDMDTEVSNAIKRQWVYLVNTGVYDKLKSNISYKTYKAI